MPQAIRVTLFKLSLVLAVVLSVVVATVAFRRGERARSAARGPRPLGSIGEGLRLAKQHPSGRALVLFLEPDEPTSAGLEEAWFEEPLASRLTGPDLLLVVLRGEADDAVLGHLYAKYTQEPRPRGACALVLDGDGKLLGSGAPRDAAALADLVGEAPRI